MSLATAQRLVGLIRLEALPDSLNTSTNGLALNVHAHITNIYLCVSSDHYTPRLVIDKQYALTLHHIF